MSAPKWTGNTWTAKMQGHDVKVTSEQLTGFRDLYVGDADLAGRMSQLLWLDMYVLSREFGIAPPEILQSIKDLEAGETALHGTKPATEFRKPPLKGLWHKHYFTARFMAANITAQLGKTGLAKMVNEVFNTGAPRVTQEMISELARRVANEPFTQREQAGKLTGEWIIYAKHSGKNFYLCLNTHNAGDQAIFDRVAAHCPKDFPDLPAWLAAYQAAGAPPSGGAG